MQCTFETILTSWTDFKIGLFLDPDFNIYRSLS